LAGLKDASHLEAFEVEMSIQRQVELSEAPPPPVFDYAHLKAILRHLFPF
jgi:fido (protein-threonine AMPylation protein)